MTTTRPSAGSPAGLETSGATSSRTIVAAVVALVGITILLRAVLLWFARVVVFDQISAESAQRWATEMARGLEQSDAAATGRFGDSYRVELTAGIRRGSISRFWLADAGGKITDASPGIESGAALTTASLEIADRLKISPADVFTGRPLVVGVAQVVVKIPRGDGGHIIFGVESDRSDLASEVFGFLEIGFIVFAAVMTLAAVPSFWVARRYDRRAVEMGSRIDALSATLAERDEMLQRALTASRTSAWEWDIVADRFRASRQSLQMLGLEEDTGPINLAAHHSRCHPDDISLVQAAFQTAVATHANYDVTYRLRRRDDVYIWVHSVGGVTFDSAGQPIRLSGTFTDVSRQQETNESLRQLTEALEGAIAASDAGYFDTHLEPFRIFWSPRLREILGIIDPTFTPGRDSFSRFVHADAAPAFADSIRVFQRGDGPLDVNVRLKQVSGREVWAHVRAIQQLSPEGKPVRHIGFVRDITREVEQTQALRANEQLLAKVIEAADAGFFDNNRIARTVMWSARFKQILGVPENFEPGYMTLVDLAHPDDRNRFVEVVRDLHSTARPVEVEFRARHAAGRYVWLSMRAISKKIDGADSAGAVGFVRDITGDKEAERALIDSETRFRTLVESSADMVVVRDGDGRLVYLSPASVTITGYAVAEMLGREADLHVHPDDVARARHNTELARAGKASSEPFLMRIRHKAGHWIWLESSVRMVPGFAGDSRAQFLSIARDVTNRVERELELRQVRDQLQMTAENLLKASQDADRAREKADRASAAKSQFLSMMSHELRTPITGILGMADLLQTSALTGEQVRYVDTLTRSARALLEPLNDLLDLSKIEAGHIELNKRDFSLTRELSAAHDHFAPILSGRGNTILLDTGGITDDVVIGDERRLHQVLINLIGNANKFTSAGQITVSATTRHTEDRRIRIDISVSDTGIGIAETDLAQLFRPFTQVGDWTERRGGTGLGLSICKQLCEAMGGGISVKSRLGVGSTFSITVVMQRGDPLRIRSAVSPEDVQSRIVRPAARALKLLVAEDNDVTRMLVETMLGRLGHAVTSVDNGVKAVAAVTSGQFDLVLMDMQMPVMDGITATAEIRARGYSASQLPIVALTADAISSHHDRYLSSGCNAVVTKPVDWVLLAETIDRQLGISSQPSELPQSPAGAPTSADFDPSGPNHLVTTLSPAVVINLIERACTNMRSYLVALEQAVATSDLPKAKREAHALKGLAQQFGFVALGEKGRAIEEGAVSIEDVKPLTEPLPALLRSAEAAFRAWSASRRG